MRILVAPHDLGIGGSQINAIDLAAGAAEAGHDVIVYGVPGPLVDLVRSHGLDFVAARPLRYRPAPSRIAQLATLARRHRLDLIHAYEWPPCLDAYYGAHLLLGVPLLCTVLSMSVSPLVPRSIPLMMGTEALGDEARRTHRRPGVGARAADRRRRRSSRRSTARRSAELRRRGRRDARRDRVAARDRSQARRAGPGDRCRRHARRAPARCASRSSATGRRQPRCGNAPPTSTRAGAGRS